MDDGRVEPVRHRLSADDYYRMGEAGILAKEDRVELIEGEIIDMAPIGQDHETAVNWLNRALVLACGDRGLVSPQNSLRISPWSAPQPDFVVLRARDDWYGKGERPAPADALLVVEVADSSLRYDRAVKLPLYARAGVGEVWIVDLTRRVLETYRGPEGERYTEQAIYRRGDSVPLLLAPEIVVRLDVVFT